MAAAIIEHLRNGRAPHSELPIDGSLDLSRWDLTDDMLAEILQYIPPLDREHGVLNLRNNRLTRASFSEVAAVVNVLHPAWVDFSKNPEIEDDPLTHDGVDHVALVFAAAGMTKADLILRAIEICAEGRDDIETLDISFNPLRDAEAKRVLNELQTYGARFVNLQSVGLSDASVPTLVNFVETNPTVQHLNISFNPDISLAGLRDILGANVRREQPVRIDVSGIAQAGVVREIIRGLESERARGAKRMRIDHTLTQGMPILRF